MVGQTQIDNAGHAHHGVGIAICFITSVAICICVGNAGSSRNGFWVKNDVIIACIQVGEEIITGIAIVIVYREGRVNFLVIPISFDVIGGRVQVNFDAVYAVGRAFVLETILVFIQPHVIAQLGFGIAFDGQTNFVGFGGKKLVVVVFTGSLKSITIPGDEIYRCIERGVHFPFDGKCISRIEVQVAKIQLDGLNQRDVCGRSGAPGWASTTAWVDVWIKFSTARVLLQRIIYGNPARSHDGFCQGRSPLG